MKQYVAIVGTIAAGKTTAAKILENKYNYVNFRLSRMLYEEADKRGLDREDRVALQDVGDALRAEHGFGVLAKRVVEKIKSDSDQNKKYVIESIRNHNELQELKNAFGENLVIISIDVPIETRYERAVDRKGQYKEHELTLDQFKSNSERDLGIGNNENEQNVARCMAMADFQVKNDGSIEELEQKLLKIIND